MFTKHVAELPHSCRHLPVTSEEEGDGDFQENVAATK